MSIISCLCIVFPFSVIFDKNVLRGKIREKEIHTLRKEALVKENQIGAKSIK